MSAVAILDMADSGAVVAWIEANVGYAPMRYDFVDEELATRETRTFDLSLDGRREAIRDTCAAWVDEAPADGVWLNGLKRKIIFSRTDGTSYRASIGDEIP